MLIQCPDCREMVSENADRCPKCGNKITPQMVERYNKEHEQDGKVLAFGCAGIIIIIIFAIISFFK